MFEGKFQIPTETTQGGGAALRAFAWAELSARLDAARELRRELRRDSYIGGASFADAAAGYFSSSDENKPRVNPDALSDGNSNRVSSGIAEDDVATGERE